MASVPALAHPGHGPDNLILHRLVHWAGSADTALLLALGTAVLAVTLAAALFGMRRKPSAGNNKAHSRQNFTKTLRLMLLRPIKGRRIAVKSPGKPS